MATPPRADAREPGMDDDALPLRIARDRQQHQLADYVSEQDLMKKYKLPRLAIKRALERLSELGVVERKLGYGWRFLLDAWDASIREESYRFRMTVEPAALREPGFVLSEDWARMMRLRHEAFLDMPWTEASSIAFFETNAAFHEGLAAASGNRFFAAAIQRQNRLRRLSNYDWRHGRERVKVNSHEHLEILARLQSGDNELAALLMHRHLESARTLRVRAAPL
jgi:DNA-binding GntR family transcriptional regulator